MTEAIFLKPTSNAQPALKPKEPGLKKKRAGGPKIPRRGDDAESVKLCVAILEVLAGARTPLDAAAALGISPPRYYALESRALGGLLEACKRRPKGPRPSPERELAKLKKDVTRLERDCGRTQALLRSAQRAAGLLNLKPPKPKAPAPDGKKSRKRRPVVRALRAVKVLRAEEARNSLETEGKKADPHELVK